MTRAERWASRVLFVGGLLGVALMVIGVVGAAVWSSSGLAQVIVDRAHAGGTRAHAADTIVSIRQIWIALSHRPRDPLGVAALGIVVLFATPLVATATAGVAFSLDRDRRFTTIAAIVVAALLVSVWLGAA